MSEQLAKVHQALLELCSTHEEAFLTAIQKDAEISQPMARWAVHSVRRQFSKKTLSEYSDGAKKTKLNGERVLLSLARSVPTAPVRSMVAALLRSPDVLVVKPSSAQSAVATLMVELFHRVGVKQIELQTSRNLSGFQRVIAFGSDETLLHIRGALDEGCVVEAYPHGFGAQLVDVATLDDAAIRSLAWDWIAFDGNGCLSPVLCLLPDATAEQAQALGEKVAAQLDDFACEFPREVKDPTWLAHERVWRAQVAANALFSAVTRTHSVHAVMAEDIDEMQRSMGGRNVLLCGCAKDVALAWLKKHTPWITTLGQNHERHEGLTKSNARIVSLGKMQLPPFDGEADPRVARK